MGKFICGFSLLLLGIGIQSSLNGAAGSAPEIDPSSAGTAIAVLAGALVVIHDRRK